MDAPCPPLSSIGKASYEHQTPTEHSKIQVHCCRYLLSAAEPQALLPVQHALPGLTLLSLEDSHLVQAQTGPFLSSQGSLKKLQHLEISRTALGDDEMQALAAGISGITGLKTLTLFR